MNPSTKMGTEMTATVLTLTNESKNLSFGSRPKPRP